MARDPDFDKKRHAQRQQRAAQDPAFALRMKQWELRAQEKKMARLHADPIYHETVKAQARARHAQLSDADKERRRQRYADRISAMSPEQYAVWSDKQRQQWRDYAASVRATPEGRERYMLYMREYMRQQAIRKLFAVGDELIKRSIEK